MSRYQETDWYCGPACISNALRFFGRKPAQKKIAQLAGTVGPEDTDSKDEWGTDQDGLLAALSELGYGYEVFESDCKREAVMWLNRAVEVPLILCCFQWKHWVMVAGICAGKYQMHDPDNSRENGRENGHHPVTLGKLMKHWRAGRKTAEGEPRFYGIAVEGPVDG